MLRTTGLLLSLTAATILAVVPAGPARADVAPPEPIEAGSAAPAVDGEALTAKLVGAGLSAEEARALVASLGAEERELLAERAEGAEVGGFVPIALGIPILLFSLVVGVMGLFGIGRVVLEEEKPASPEPAPAPAPAENLETPRP